MKKKNANLNMTLPVLMSFIVMGFVDLVGVITAYVKDDFDLTNDVAQLIPLMVFVWFFLLSVPTGIIQDKIGKKNMLMIGIGFTFIGMLIPFIIYSFIFIFIAVIFLGIGNTIIQVSSNPLLHDVVPKEKFSSFMSLSQFIKAICSLLGPIITASVASVFGDWKLVFLVFAATSLLSAGWLYFTPIDEVKSLDNPASFKTCLGLLKNRFVLIMTLAILLIVGADVGMNTNIPIYLNAVFDLSLEQASLGISIYFAAVMIGRLSGAVLLNWISARKFLFWTVIFALSGVILMIIAPSLFFARVSVFMIGLGAANTFPLVFSITLAKMPARSNEISGLMIMAVSGGAILPPLMGIVSTFWGIIPSLFILLAAFIYVLSAGIYSLKQ